MGLRFEPTIKFTDDEQTREEKNDCVCFSSSVDKAFKVKRDFIERRRNECNVNLERYNVSNNKYIMQIIKQNVATRHLNDESTFLDAMYAFIMRNHQHIREKNAVKLIEYINDNEYDSDAVKQDLNDLTVSNICQNNFICIPLISNLVRDILSESILFNSFSTGFIFFYWDYYKTMTDMEIEQHDQYNQHQKQNGYSVTELLVSPHYSSLKIEVLSSQFVTIKQWHETIFVKAHEYYQSQIVKTMKCNDPYYYNKHEIYPQDTLSLFHLFCIILYCDMTDLCTDFSATFRKKDEFETLTVLKVRHSKYYHFAKGLVEAVIDFGISGYKENGPFYCGLSCMLKIPQFAIYLKCPCSTSKSIVTAMNFANRHGMILSLQNDNGHSRMQYFFDCSWISRFSSENERLFVGGDRRLERLRVESIRSIDTAENFQNFFHCFYVFDMMISGARKPGTIFESDIDILNTLINNKLNINSKSKLNQYIVETFDLYLSQKTEITIHLPLLHKYFKGKMSDFIMHYVLEERERKIQCENGKNIDFANVFKAKTFEIFPKIIQMVIITNLSYDDNSYKEYRFSLESFLSSIETLQTCRKYVIKANRKGNVYRSKFKYSGTTWLNNILTSSLQKAFTSAKWSVHRSKEYCLNNHGYGVKGAYTGDSLTISKVGENCMSKR
eukprot:449553_1